MFFSIAIFLLFRGRSSKIKHQNKRLKIRILREISAPEPAPKVWYPKSRSENYMFITVVSVFQIFSILAGGVACKIEFYVKDAIEAAWNVWKPKIWLSNNGLFFQHTVLVHTHKTNGKT